MNGGAVFNPNASPGWFDWLGLVLTVGSFLFAGVQLYRVKSASEESNRALLAARSDVIRGQIAAMALHLSTVSHDLDFAMQTNNPIVAHRALWRYGGIAEEISSLLNGQVLPDRDLADRFKTSGATALDIKERLMTRKSLDTVRMVKDIDTEIAHLSREIAGVMASAGLKIGDIDV